MLCLSVYLWQGLEWLFTEFDLVSENKRYNWVVWLNLIILENLEMKMMILGLHILSSESVKDDKFVDLP